MVSATVSAGEYWPYLTILGLTILLLRKYLVHQEDNGRKRAIGIQSAAVAQEKATKRKESADAPDGDENSSDDYQPPISPDKVEMVLYQGPKFTEAEMLSRSKEFYQFMNLRRTLRFYSDRPVPMQVMENIIRTAGTSPSGAHTEPWSYVLVSDPDMKDEVRRIIEAEEEINYTKRMGHQWTSDLAFVRINWEKPYLTEAPYLVLMFKQVYGLRDTGQKKVHYYNEISCSISCGLFLAAVHNAGLATLTSTPLNCGPALRALLGRPANEKLLLLLPVGYAAEDATVPDIGRKSLDEIMTVY
eukprot:maker-scaffold92_size382268-snap-gene-2.28 protein:Tk08761 transcript:maker-scaffold92_size382268-snap-gene-2.28-mRNA-1 annotation:"iodotyrosine dehalogenase 1"